MGVDIPIPPPSIASSSVTGWKQCNPTIKEDSTRCASSRTGVRCDAWRFFEGKCGEAHSICAKQNLVQVVKADGGNPFSREYAVCVDEDTGAEIASVTELAGMPDRFRAATVPSSPALIPGPSTTGAEVSAPLPSAWDWRNHEGENWMTPVKDQSTCGSCWAFSSVGVTEAVYNIAKQCPELNLDLSEEYLNSDCTPLAPGNCCGGTNIAGLEAIQEEGIPDEACIPYDVPYMIRERVPAIMVTSVRGPAMDCPRTAAICSVPTRARTLITDGSRSPALCPSPRMRGR